MIALCFICLVQGAVVGFIVTFVACFCFDGDAAANLGFVAEMSWVGSFIVEVLRRAPLRRQLVVARCNLSYQHPKK
jgi:dolichol kinase